MSDVITPSNTAQRTQQQQRQQETPAPAPAPPPPKPSWGGSDRFETGSTAAGNRTPPALPEASAPPMPAATSNRGALGQAQGFVEGAFEGGVETVKGVVSLAQGAWSLTGGWATNPEASKQTVENLKATVETVVNEPGAVVRGLVKPITDPWQAGEYGKAIGRGAFEVAAAVVGTKGLDKLAKAGRAGEVASAATRVDDVAVAAQRLDKASSAAPLAPRRGLAKPAVPEVPPAVAARRAENAQLIANGQLAKDAEKVGVSPERLQAMFDKKVPLSFKDPEQFAAFKTDLSKALKESGLPDAHVEMRGTSTTFYSENPTKRLGHHFDGQGPADVDVSVQSSTLVNKMDAVGAKASKKNDAIYGWVDTNTNFPALKAFSERWEKILGREVNVISSTSRTKAVDPAAFQL